MDLQDVQSSVALENIIVTVSLHVCILPLNLQNYTEIVSFSVD